MNNTMDNSTSSMSTDMNTWVPWVHFGLSDSLIFESLRPASPGVVVGICIVLFLFSILERYIAGFRRTQESRWRAEAMLASGRRHSGVEKEDGIVAYGDGPNPAQRQLTPPFMLSRDTLRGVIHATQATIAYTLMLTVMTYNLAYIITIILGLGVGEILFGRIGSL